MSLRFRDIELSASPKILTIKHEIEEFWFCEQDLLSEHTFVNKKYYKLKTQGLLTKWVAVVGKRQQAKLVAKTQVKIFVKAFLTYISEKPFNSSSSETIDNNIGIVRVLSLESSHILRTVPSADHLSLLGLPGQVNGLPSETTLPAPQKAAVEKGSRKDGTVAEGPYSEYLISCVKDGPAVSNTNVDSVIELVSSESAVPADGMSWDNDVDSRKYVQEAKNESNFSQEQPTAMQVEEKAIIVEACASVIDDVVSAVFEQVIETPHGKLDKDAGDAEGSCSHALGSCAKGEPAVSNTNVDSVIELVSSESAALADGISVDDQVDSRKYVQEAKNESNVSQEQPTAMQVEEKATIVEACASVMDDVVSCVFEQVTETRHGKLDKDGCDAEGSCSDVLESCVQEGPAVSNTNVDSVIQVVSSESAALADGISVDDEVDSRKYVQEAKNESNVSQEQPTAMQVEEKATIVETCASVIDDAVRAVFEQFTETPHGKLEKDGCDAEGSYSDALGSFVKVEPVVSNTNVDSVIQMDSSESAVLADGIIVDNDVDSRKYVQEAKNESNVSQEQPTTMQVEKRSISVETCASVIDDVVSTVFEQFTETPHGKLDKDGSDAECLTLTLWDRLSR
eukprot:gene4970-5618_t